MTPHRASAARVSIRVTRPRAMVLIAMTPCDKPSPARRSIRSTAATDTTPNSKVARSRSLRTVLGALVGSHDAVAALSLDLSRSDLNWLILRPSLLLDGPGIGTVSLGPAEFHARIARDDVAATLVELIHEPRIGRQILELNTGTTPIEEAVRANVCS